GLGVIRDITREKESDRLKSEFVSLASHQLRTPATAVKGLLSIILDGYNGKVAEGQADTLKQAFNENEHQLKLIDDMLDVDKLDAGEMLLEKSQVNLSKLLRQVMAEQKELIRSRGQTVRLISPR